MLQSTIILALLEQLAAEADPVKRIELMRAAERQYYLDMEHQSNFVQTRIGGLELDIREQVATSLGATNEMISQLVADSRQDRDERTKYIAANTAALEGLHLKMEAGFQAINAIGERVTQNEARLDEHDAALADFRASRARSMARHDKTQAQLTELAARLDAFMQRIEALIAENPVTDPAERAAMIEHIRRGMAREAGDERG
jgi:hypothetical protein